MRCAVIARHRDEFPVRLMCRVLDVSVSGFYAYLRRPLSWRRMLDELLMAHVRIAFAASGDTYGAPRVLQEIAHSIVSGPRNLCGTTSSGIDQRNLRQRLRHGTPMDRVATEFDLCLRSSRNNKATSRERPAVKLW